jgi:hypothetical protein
LFQLPRPHLFLSLTDPGSLSSSPLTQVLPGPGSDRLGSLNPLGPRDKRFLARREWGLRLILLSPPSPALFWVCLNKLRGERRSRERDYPGSTPHSQTPERGTRSLARRRRAPPGAVGPSLPHPPHVLRPPSPTPRGASG